MCINLFRIYLPVLVTKYCTGQYLVTVCFFGETAEEEVVPVGVPMLSLWLSTGKFFRNK